MASGRFCISEIATSHCGMRCATVDHDDTVWIWDIEDGSLVSKFPTCFDFGGPRLAITPDGALCATGSYDEHGVECYRVSDGCVLWRRPDLRKIQGLSFDPPRRCWVACFDEKPCHLLERDTGRTISKLSRVREMVTSPYDEVTFYEKNRDKPLELRHSRTGRRIARIKRAAPHVLSRAFGSGLVIVAEMTGAIVRRTPDDQFEFTGEFDPPGGGPLRCFSVDDGRELWCYKPGEGNHFIGISYARTTQRLYGILREEKAEGVVLTLVGFDARKGELLPHTQLELRHTTEAEFALGGDLLVTSTGDVLDLTSERPQLRLRLQIPEA